MKKKTSVTFLYESFEGHLCFLPNLKPKPIEIYDSIAHCSKSGLITKVAVESVSAARGLPPQIDKAKSALIELMGQKLYGQ